MTSAPRKFLMLQGPHGPFFGQLGKQLVSLGHEVSRIGFNFGDAWFWPLPNYTAFTGGLTDWPFFLDDYVQAQGITDIVLYGDTRYRHEVAVQLAKAKGITLHVFEEGYLRPFWVTYERDGANGYSPLMGINMDEMRTSVEHLTRNLFEAPADWGETRQHVYWGALYHALVLMAPGHYRKFTTHRKRGIKSEFRSHFEHLITRPYKATRRRIAERRIKHGSFSYSLVLLQLAHDASIQHHSSFRDMISFIRMCLQDFAKGAPKHQHLVFKAHPLEDYFQPLYRYTFQRAAQLGITDRVHFVEGGRLADLLDTAESAVTVNSTAAQQALWRGLPVKTLGRSVLDKPELISDQSLEAFFRAPKYPDMDAYMIYRRFMLETCQVFGGFYSRRGRANVMRRVIPWILQKKSPYMNVLLPGDEEAERPRLRLVK
ncbi:MAG: capsule biosynthesis protein CapA [Pseudomonadota bacterium]